MPPRSNAQEAYRCDCDKCNGKARSYRTWQKHANARANARLTTTFSEFLAAKAVPSSDSARPTSAATTGNSSSSGSRQNAIGSTDFSQKFLEKTSGEVSALSGTGSGISDCMDEDLGQGGMRDTPDILFENDSIHGAKLANSRATSPTNSVQAHEDCHLDEEESDDPDTLGLEQMEQNLGRRDKEQQAILNQLRAPLVEQDPNHPPSTEEESDIDAVRIAQLFANAVKGASLEDRWTPSHVKEQLLNPSREDVSISDPNTRLAIDLYLATSRASEQVYSDVRTAYLARHPDEDLPSYHSIKKLVSNLTGIVTVTHDMCIHGCHAFTGPWEDLENCYYCQEPRYDPATFQLNGKKIPQKQFDTILLGPQLQARRSHPDTADALRYRAEKLKTVDEQIQTLLNRGDTEGNEFVYDDIMCGREFRDLASRANMTEDDFVVSLSMDGFQLYSNKKSDSTLVIFMLEDFGPNRRFKLENILPACFIKGPFKPSNSESYLFPTLHHVSALQNANGGRGFKCWDPRREQEVLSRVLFALATADRMGLPDLDGRVPHHGARGCRSDCEMIGRHKPNSGHYYAAHLCPKNSETNNIPHPDVDVRKLTHANPEKYLQRLALVSSSRTATEYAANRKVTGICKPSILSGLNPSLMYPLPLCFGPDLMHLWDNVQKLLISLWRGTIDCAKTDNKANWPWRTLIGTTWTEHGQRIADAASFFPSCFHRPPRNPAEKISSGYKTTEYFLYVFGLGPGHFRSILPQPYYRNFCRLVRATKVLNNRSVTGAQIAEAEKDLAYFVIEYEQLYYQRREDRLQVCCPCIHSLLHLAQETRRLGPGCYYSQYRLERTIGEYGSQVRQHSNPFSNFSKRMVQRAEINALYAMHPQLSPGSSVTIPRGGLDCGGGFVLLRKRDARPHSIPGRAGELIFEKYGLKKIRRWSRWRLPDGHVPRSIWKEKGMTRRRIRVSRNVKFRRNGQVEYGEVHFYGCVDPPSSESDSAGVQVQREVFAIVSVYPRPHQGLYDDSLGVLWASKHPSDSDTALCIIDAQTIEAVVSMQPLPPQYDVQGDYYFVVEKPGIDDLHFDEGAGVLADLEEGIG